MAGQEKKIKYAKEFFISEMGEVIKMAAVITDNPEIKATLEKDVRISENNAKPTKGQKKTKFESGDIAPVFISILKVDNTSQGYDETGAKVRSEFKVILFHCLNKEH